MTQIFRGNTLNVRKQIADALDLKANIDDPSFTGDMTVAGDTATSSITHTNTTAASTSNVVQLSQSLNTTVALRAAFRLVTNLTTTTDASANARTLIQQRVGGSFVNIGTFNAGNWGVGTITPTARLHIGAGTASTAPLKLTSGTSLTTPEAGAVEFNGNSLYFTTVATRRAATIANGVITADTTVANTTTETTEFTEEIAADELHAGQRVRVFVDGIYSTANASDTFTLRVKVGGTTVATLTSTAGNVADAPFSLDFAMTVRSAGATGSAVTRTTGIFDDAVQQAATTGALVLDTTVSEDITVTVQWSAANAGNSLTVQQGHAEFIN